MDIENNYKELNNKNKINIYLNSTQYNKWILTEEELLNKQKEKYEKGLKILFSLYKNNIQDNTTSCDGLNNQLTSTNHFKKSGIKPDQEKIVIKHFIKLIIKTINHNNFSTTLRTHVITYFKRFFIKKLIFDYDIYFVFYGCFYIGFKVCEMDVSIAKMKDIFTYLAEDNKCKVLLDYEFYILDLLGYDLHVFCPYKALKGLIYKLFINFFINFLDLKKDFFKFENIILNDCINIIDYSFISDINFKTSYSYIALYSLNYYAKNEIPKKIKNTLTNNSNEVSLVDYSDLKTKINNFITSIILENTNISIEEYYNRYDVFEKEINNEMNLEISKEETNRLLKKTAKFLNENQLYLDKLNNNRKNYIAKLTNFSSSFNNLINENSRTVMTDNNTLNCNNKEIVENTNKSIKNEFINQKKKIN